MALLDDALLARKCVISVMGAHAGEDAAAIFSRKIGDCRSVGRTYWVAKSAKARPNKRMNLTRPSAAIHCSRSPRRLCAGRWVSSTQPRAPCIA